MKDAITKKKFVLNKEHVRQFLKNNYLALSKSQFHEDFKEPSYKTLQNKFFAIVDDEIVMGLEAQKFSKSLAVYHLQQAVEKLVKGWMLAYGMPYKQIRKSSHNTHELFINVFKSNAPQICEVASIYQKKGTTLQIFQQLKKYDTSPSLKIAKISKERIDFFLKKLKAIRVKNDNSPENLESWYEYLYDLFKDLPKNRFMIDKESLRKNFGPDIFTKFYNYQVGFIALFVLSYLTFSHDNWSRYPKYPVNSKNILEYDDYVEGLGIVDRTEELLELCSQCREDYSNFDFEEINETIAKLNFVFLDQQ